MTVPTEADWGPVEGIDEGSARDRFLGVSHERAWEMFAKDAMTYIEDLAYMPPACCRFYVQACCRYLLSPASARDSDGASSFISFIQLFGQDLRGTDAEEIVKATLDHIGRGQEHYEADPNVYGSFEERCLVALAAFAV